MYDIQSGIKLNNLQLEGHCIGTWEEAALEFVCGHTSELCMISLVFIKLFFLLRLFKVTYFVIFELFSYSFLTIIIRLCLYMYMLKSLHS